MLDTIESLLTIRVRNEAFILAKSSFKGDILLTLSKNGSILYSRLITKTIPQFLIDIRDRN
jgi:hypothetical protein